MVESRKHVQNHEGGGNGVLVDLKSLCSVLDSRRAKAFAYGFLIIFIACTALMAGNASPSFNTLLTTAGNRLYKFPPRIYSIFTNSTPISRPQQPERYFSSNDGDVDSDVDLGLQKISLLGQNRTIDANFDNNRTVRVVGFPENTTQSSIAVLPLQKNHTENPTGSSDLEKNASVSSRVGDNVVNGELKNLTDSLENKKKIKEEEIISIRSLVGCDLYEGRWVEDDSYPLYGEGSCPHIDEPFNCFLNGRPDRHYQKLRWQPHGCRIPRFNATNMLEILRGKRLVFVGDSLNRNMWESLVCSLRNSIKDKNKVFEMSGRSEFRTEGSYSFFFQDYECTVEFFRSPFLVQEWEIPGSHGKETLRLDLIERSSSKYKNADVIIFNTGHWWTHEKTSKGENYYQEGDHVYKELNVIQAFHKALNTWSKWADASINPNKTLVFFRGFSSVHFSGGQWNSGGQCNNETEPIKKDEFLSPYPPKMRVLETVLQGMKTPVSYMNITRMSDYRKDGHPSIYRKQKLTGDEPQLPESYQDCSHWCLPGVPDSWNELLYLHILIKQYSGN